MDAISQEVGITGITSASITGSGPATGLLRYRVDRVQIVAPGDTEVLDPSVGTDLTLVTCYPFYFIGAAPERFVVHARNIEQK